MDCSGEALRECGLVVMECGLAVKAGGRKFRATLVHILSLMAAKIKRLNRLAKARGRKIAEQEAEIARLKEELGGAGGRGGSGGYGRSDKKAYP
jgi:hypothetical protein